MKVPGNKVPYMELSLPGAKVRGNESSSYHDCILPILKRRNFKDFSSEMLSTWMSQEAFIVYTQRHDITKKYNFVSL